MRWRLVVILLMVVAIIPGESTVETKGVSYPSTTIYIYESQNLSQSITLIPENETWYSINISAPEGIIAYPSCKTLVINSTTEFIYYLFANISYYRGEIVISIHENYTNGEGNTIERYYILSISVVVGEAYAVKISTLSTILHVPITKDIRVSPLETNYTVPVQIKKTPATFYLPEGFYRFEATDGSGGVDLYIAGSMSIVILCFSWIDYILIAVTATLLAIAITIIIKRYRVKTEIVG